MVAKLLRMIKDMVEHEDDGRERICLKIGLEEERQHFGYKKPVTKKGDKKDDRNPDFCVI